MNSAIVIVALCTTAVAVGIVLFRPVRAGRRATAGAGRGRKLRKDWRRWLFGEHNIPFN